MPEATSVATIICDELQRRGKSVFLDVDQRFLDLRSLMRKASTAKVLVVILTAKIFERPWCCAEVWAACNANVPIVPVLVEGAGFDHARAHKYLTHLDAFMSQSALRVLRDADVDPLEAAWEISFAIVSIIAKPFNSHYSSRIREAMLHEIACAVDEAALPEFPSLEFEEWLRQRSPRKPVYIIYRWTEGKHLTDDIRGLLADHNTAVVVDQVGLLDLRQIRNAMSPCGKVVAVLSKEFFERPWCVAELIVASELQLPVVFVTSDNAWSRNSARLRSTMDLIDLRLNDDTKVKLRRAGVDDLARAAHALSAAYSTERKIHEVNLHASARVKRAMLLDFLDALEEAQFHGEDIPFELWEQRREDTRRSVEDERATTLGFSFALPS